MLASRGASAALVAALVLTGAACSSGTGATEDIAPTPTTATSAPAGTTTGSSTGTPDDTPSASPDTTVLAGIIVAMVGDTVRTQEGNLVTVHSLELPLAVAHPDPTKVYAAADIEGCAGKDVHDAGVAPGFFRIELRNNTQWPPVQPVKQPALQPTKLAPGRCARGWVSFSVPKAVEPVVVALRSTSRVAWRLR